MNDQFEFHQIPYTAREVPLTLQPLLWEGGAACDMRIFWKKVIDNKLGAMHESRVTLIRTIYNLLSDIVVAGGSRETLKTGVNHVRSFYKCADLYRMHPTAETALVVYCKWVKDLYERRKIDNTNGSEAGIYGAASFMASLLGEATELGRDTFVVTSGLQPPRKSSAALGAKVDRQNFSQTKKFAEVLIDIINSISNDRCLGALPLKITFRSGLSVEHYAAAKRNASVPAAGSNILLDTSPSIRYPVFNIRIEAEMLLFMSQTSMNLSEASKLKLQDFRFKEEGAFTQVYAYKGRKKGEVIFTIFKEYKPFFLNYLAFRRLINSEANSSLLFGRFPQPGNPVSRNPNPRSLIMFLKRMGVPHRPASEFRKTRQNWLARKSGNPEMASEMAQHDLETYARNYAKPHHQTAATEFAGFYARLAENRKAALGGGCVEVNPIPIASTPLEINIPDCINPALCLFCVNYKGQITYDYIWALLTFGRLKMYEDLCHRKGQAGGITENSIVKRVREIAKQFSEVNAKCSGWYLKADGKVRAGEYHPRWAGFFDIIDAVLI